MRPTQTPAGQVPICQHSGARGLCGQELDAEAHHASTCPTGGLVIQRHDRLARWLFRWLSQGRTSGTPRLEQVLPSERGRLDIVFEDEGLQYWCDVAVTSAVSSCPRTLQARSETDGAAARAEEAVKRHRYRAKAVPIVVEADGRPGSSCLSFVRQFAGMCGESSSSCPARAWRCFSSMLQSGNAEIEIAAWGRNAVLNNLVRYHVP